MFKHFKDYRTYEINRTHTGGTTLQIVMAQVLYSAIIEKMYGAIPWKTKRKKEHDNNIYELIDITNPNGTILFMCNCTFMTFANGQTYFPKSMFLYNKETKEIFEHRDFEIKDYIKEQAEPQYETAAPFSKDIAYHTSTIEALDNLIDSYLRRMSDGDNA